MSELPADFILKTELQLAKLKEALSIWKETGLPEKTIIILLAHSTKVPQKTIKKVFEGINNLSFDYFEDHT